MFKIIKKIRNKFRKNNKDGWEKQLKQISKLEKEVIELSIRNNLKQTDLKEAVKRVKQLSLELTDLTNEITKNQNYIEELRNEILSGYDQFSAEYASAMEDFYRRQGVNTGNYQEHLEDYSFFRKFKEQMSKEFLEVNQENQKLKQNNKELEEKVKSLLQLKEIEKEFREMEVKIETTLPKIWKN